MTTPSKLPLIRDASVVPLGNSNVKKEAYCLG